MSPFFHSFFPLFYSVPALSFLCYSPVHRARNNFEKVEGNQIFRDFLPSECRLKSKTLLSWTKSRYLPDSLSMRIIKSNQKLTDDWRPLFVEFPSSHPLWKVFYKSSVLGRQFMRISGEGFLYRAFLYHFLNYIQRDSYVSFTNLLFARFRSRYIFFDSHQNSKPGRLSNLPYRHTGASER